MRLPRILDTGPLVSFLNRRDQYHPWASDVFARTPAPFLTCEAVLSEACFLLRSSPRGVEAVGELLRREVLVLAFQAGDHTERLADLMNHYSDVPMAFADACLVRMSELHADASIVTLDSDFRVYRKLKRRAIEVLLPR